MIRNTMEATLENYPQGNSKYDAIKIGSIIENFKTTTKQAEKITKKYMPGQEVLTIDYLLYDSLEDYYKYLLNNKESILQGLEEILNRVKELDK